MATPSASRGSIRDSLFLECPSPRAETASPIQSPSGPFRGATPGTSLETGAGMEDERIEIDDRVGFGRPRIRGTRVPLDVLFARLAAGMAEAEVAKEYGIDV